MKVIIPPIGLILFSQHTTDETTLELALHSLLNQEDPNRENTLLFTGTDIFMEPSTLSRAVAHFVDKELDHLSLFFRNVAPGDLLNAMVVDAPDGLFLLLRPRHVSRLESWPLSVWAPLTLLSKAYRKLGGHTYGLENTSHQRYHAGEEDQTAGTDSGPPARQRICPGSAV